MARNRPPNKKPEITAEDKLKYTKSKINNLEKELDILRERVKILERQVMSLTPKKIKEEKSEDEERQDILRRVHPRYYKDDND